MKKHVSNNQRLLIAAIVVIIISIIVTSSSVIRTEQTKNNNNNERTILAEETIDYEFKVTNYVGFNLDTDKLYLGSGGPGSTLRRAMKISYTEDSIVEISARGPGEIIISDNNFFLEKDTGKDIEFSLVVPQIDLGNYTGEIKLTFYKP